MQGNRLSNAVERNQSNLIENIEVVEVTFVKDQLQQHGICRHIHRLELSRLKATSLVWIETEIADPFEFNLVQRNLVGQSLLSTRQKSEEFNL